MENHYFVFIGKSINGPFSIATVCEFTGRQHHIAQFWVRNQRMMGSYSGGGFLFGLDCFTLPYVPGRCLVDRCYYVLLQSNKCLSMYIYIYVQTQNCIPLDVFSKNLGRHSVYGYYIALYHWLVLWKMAFIFPYIGNVIIPTDFHSIIFQRGRSTTNQRIP